MVVLRGGLVASLYQERRFNDIVVLGEEVQWQRCIRREFIDIGVLGEEVQ